MDHYPESQWVSMEEYGMKECQESLSLNSHFSTGKITNVWVKHTLKIWNKIQKQLKGKTALSRAITIKGNIEFLPSLSDNSSFRGWAERGLLTVDQLFDKNVFKTFTQLRAKFKLPSSDLYKYFQIRGYVTKHSD